MMTTNPDDLRTLQKQIAIGIAIGDAAALIGFLIAQAFSWQTLTGLLYGSMFSFIGFYLLCRHAQRAVQLDEKGAKRYMTSRYMLRFLLYGAAITVGLLSPWLNSFAVVIPFLFPQIAILVMHVRKRRL